MALVVPLRTPLQDERGNLTRPWIIFLEQLATQASGATVTNQTVDLPDGAGTTTISSAVDAVEGAVLALRIRQGTPTGGQQIAFSAQFAASTTVDILMGAGEETRRLFVGGVDQLWYEFSSLG